MADLFQTDLKLGQMTRPGQPITRVTLSLSPTGDIQVVSGKDKLAEQLVRAIVNDSVTGAGVAVNSRSVTKKQLLTLVTLIMRNFKQSQVDQTNQSDPRKLGYYIYRFDQYTTSTDFVRVSTDPVTWQFIDTKVNNGTNYTYGITYLYNDGVTESSILEKVNVTPTTHIDNQNPVIGSYFVAMPGNQTVTIYVDFNRIFKKAELLESIGQISVEQDPNEPRGYVVNIEVTSLDGNNVNISSLRYKAE